MITKCPAPLLKKEGLMDPETGEEIVYNPPGFNYNDELEASVIEAPTCLRQHVISLHNTWHVLFSYQRN